nr:DHHA1 domain-containing protein [Mycoplasmopsis bovis]
MIQSASSASEIVTEILMFVQKVISIKPFVAQMLLNGIYLDTLQFTKKVNARTFIVFAGWLEEKGANSAKSSEILKIDEDTWNDVNDLLSNIQEVKPGYFLAYKDIPLTNDVISIASEEILKISGRKASFVIAKLKGTKFYKMSARGLDVNVQLIAEAVGGGGHFGTAAPYLVKNLAHLLIMLNKRLWVRKMKVILIKDCKDGKANTIIEVSDGYGSNFLINKGFAVPYNEKTKKQLEKKLSDLTASEMEARQSALELKEKLEKEVLKYELEANIDGNNNLNVQWCSFNQGYC